MSILCILYFYGWLPRIVVYLITLLKNMSKKWKLEQTIFGSMTLSIMTFRITTLSIMLIGMAGLFARVITMPVSIKSCVQLCWISHFHCYAECYAICRYAECFYAERHGSLTFYDTFVVVLVNIDINIVRIGFS